MPLAIQKRESTKYVLEEIATARFSTLGFAICCWYFLNSLKTVNLYLSTRFNDFGLEINLRPIKISLN